MSQIDLAGLSVLISYSTPVAYYDHDIGLLYVTEKKWSSTTSRHINIWCNLLGERGRIINLKLPITQEELDTLYRNMEMTKDRLNLMSVQLRERFSDLLVDD